jgi:hypothetical protein
MQARWLYQRDEHKINAELLLKVFDIDQQICIQAALRAIVTEKTVAEIVRNAGWLSVCHAIPGL